MKEKKSSHPTDSRLQTSDSELPLYIAVDLGAGSGRVFLADVGDEFRLEEVRRFHYPPRRLDGALRWDAAKIFDEIKAGLREAGARARALRRPIHSLGIDSWAVDYGLLDAADCLLADPICYRDERTQGVMAEVFAQLSRQEIFARTGIQFLVFNTLYQLYAETRAGVPESAVRLLLMPDLLNCLLTGRAVTEYTNATTTQMVNAAAQTWDAQMLARLALPARLLTEIVAAGTEIGLLKPALGEELGLENVRVVAPATHDTASAVVGTPLEKSWAYLSSGTWSLVGVERAEVLINEEVARHNFTNEGGAFGTVRFLKNVMGLWILEACRNEWRARGLAVEHDTLLAEVATLTDDDGSGELIFPDDPRFLNPSSMLDAIAAQLGEALSDNPAVVTRLILDSLALRYASVLRAIERLTGEPLAGLHIVGGGSRNDYLNQVTATATGLPVLAGPVEATVAGNVLVQAIAAGRFASLAEARQYLRQHLSLTKYEPRPSPAWAAKSQRYGAIEARYEEGLKGKRIED